jgi:4-amino-4-deoxy-L-arabinose transferase-like glycosyltransferase
MSTNAASRAGVVIAPPHGALVDLVYRWGGLFDRVAPEARVRTAHWAWVVALTLGAALVRFWGLGNVGLHGDEETMALAVRHILIDGQPTLPSGMFYPRGMTQLYLMAASVSVFGEYEWALRLPSVICGILLVPLAFITGRRFLTPTWSVAFAASVAFLPVLIVDSQTARMYIFMVAAVMAGMAGVFAWERTDRRGWLAAAVAVLIIGLDMHALAVASVLIFLWPGIVHGDPRRLIYGIAAAALVALAYILINEWVNAQYAVPPPEFASAFGPPQWERMRSEPEFALTFDIALWATGLVLAFLALHVARILRARIAMIGATLLLLTGVFLQIALYYHLAALFYIAGAVVALRFSAAPVMRRLTIFAFGCAVIALIHVTLLASNTGSVLKLIGAIVGQPSVWPYVRVAQLSVGAGVLTGALLVWGLFRLATGKKVADYWMLAILAVWAPVFALGMFAWNVPPRYTEMSLVPMLLCGFAVAQHGCEWLASRIDAKPLHAICAVLVAVAVVNPVASARVINSGYGLYPDHKGAAQFIREQGIGPDDVLIAEDVLQQTYYLGRVDYWLIGGNIARRFVKSAGEGKVVDFYTGTPVIATGAMLEQALQKHAGKRVFVIGSGEQQSDGRRNARGPELYAALESPRFEVVYTGRDDVTRVWRVVPDASPLPPATKDQAKRDARELAREAEAAEAAASERHPLPAAPPPSPLE